MERNFSSISHISFGRAFYFAYVDIKELFYCQFLLFGGIL